MKKYMLITLALLLGVSFGAHAQKKTMFGVKGAVDFAQVTHNEGLGKELLNSNAGYNVGFFIEQRYEGKVGLQTEFLYSSGKYGNIILSFRKRFF